jgi:hypothetical protein
LFVVRFYLNARQRNSLPCIFFLAHDKHFFPHTGCYPRSQPLACTLSLSCARTRRMAKTISLSCALWKHTANYFFAVRFPTMHDKVFFKKLNLYSLLFLHYKNIILYSIFQFYMCLD